MVYAKKSNSSSYAMDMQGNCNSISWMIWTDRKPISIIPVWLLNEYQISFLYQFINNTCASNLQGSLDVLDQLNFTPSTPSKEEILLKAPTILMEIPCIHMYSKRECYLKLMGNNKYTTVILSDGWSSPIVFIL